ncbi:NUDIX hydrolase [Kineococcus arenarius]|uniref:NUDIX hydrolase n=2 Tax=unclassified Kineococcus TaxID=2621656 RepID=UPI003D7E3D11
MSDRFSVPVAVQALLVRDGRLLTLRRAGTGHRDGELGLPAGHLEGGEDAVAGLVREVAEEVGVDLEREACRLAVTLHTAAESATDREHLHLFFAVDGWSGEPRIGEPGKCSGLAWVDPDDPPVDLIDYVRSAVDAWSAGRPLVLHGWAAGGTG